MKFWRIFFSALLMFQIPLCTPKAKENLECVDIHVSKSWLSENHVPYSGKALQIKSIPYGQTQEFVTDNFGSVNACLPRGLYIIDPNGVNNEYLVFFSGDTKEVGLNLLDPSIIVCIETIGEDDLIVKYTDFDGKDKTYIGKGDICGLAGIWGFSVDGVSWYVKNVQNNLRIYTEDLK
ncbi:MAG: hypothetical protein QXF88_00560 [Candidatus Aenigmatarchaeota archaeon]